MILFDWCQNSYGVLVAGTLLLCLSCLPHPVSAVTLVDFYGPEQMYSSAFFFGYLKSETYIPICMPFHILMGGKMDWPSLRYWEQSLLFH